MYLACELRHISSRRICRLHVLVTNIILKITETTCKILPKSMLLNLYAPPNSFKPTPPPLLFFTSD